MRVIPFNRYLDEFTNEQLPFVENLSSYTGAIRGELLRVDSLIGSRILCGDDLTYWFKREDILRGFLL